MTAKIKDDCIEKWILNLKKRNNVETNCYLDFVNTYDNLNTFTIKIENELGSGTNYFGKSILKK